MNYLLLSAGCRQHFQRASGIVVTRGLLNNKGACLVALPLGLKLAWKQSDRLDLTAGARILEGGADNDKVYNFSSFAYLTFGARLRF